MIEMKYSYPRLENPIVLFDKIINGYRCIALNLGTHPCAYIQISEYHKYANKDVYKDDLEVGCHWGFNFLRKYEKDDYLPQGLWIGWSYDHSDDYTAYPINKRFGSKWACQSYDELENPKEHETVWTTEKIYQECVRVTNDMIHVKGGEEYKEYVYSKEDFKYYSTIYFEETSTNYKNISFNCPNCVGYVNDKIELKIKAIVNNGEYTVEIKPIQKGKLKCVCCGTEYELK